MRIRGDHFGYLTTTFVSFWLSISSAHAGVDLSLGGTYRAYPLAGIASAQIGYGIPFWGKLGTPFYGYIRPRLDLSTIGTYNSVGGALEFFPIAFLGARVGGEASENNSDYAAYECDTPGVHCEGRYHRTYFEAELSLGAGPVFLHGSWRRERWTQETSNVNFIEPTSGVLLLGSGDSETVYLGVLGFKIVPQISLIGIVRYAESDNLHGWSRMPYAVIRYTSGPWTIAVGAGEFESSLKEKDLTAVASIRWEIWPSVSLK